MDKLNSMYFTQAPMSPIIGLKPGMEAFKRVSG